MYRLGWGPSGDFVFKSNVRSMLRSVRVFGRLLETNQEII